MLTPLVCSRFKDPRFRRLERPFAFEMELEKRQLDLFTEEDGGLGTEGDVAERGTVGLSSIPTAVNPRPHDQEILRVGTGGFESLVRLQRSEEFLRVEPTSHRHDLRTDVLQVRPMIACLPELVVSQTLQRQSDRVSWLIN